MKRLALLTILVGLVLGMATAAAGSPSADCGGAFNPPCTPVPAGGNNVNPGDPDGDGVPNGIDQCPDQGGPSSNQGCPPGTVPSATPAPESTAQGISLPAMPLTGDCVAATRSAEGVNIRLQPSVSAGIVGVLDPQSLYPVNGQHHAADGTWDRIENGWVAGRVVRTGGNCGSLPVVVVPDDIPPETISCDADELIHAIEHASDGSTISLAPGCIYTLTHPYHETYFGLPAIKIRLTINGNGATIRRRNTEATPRFGIFVVNETFGLRLNDLTLRNGSTPYYGYCAPCGPAVENESGSVVLNNVTFSSNTSGAVKNVGGGTLTVANSTFSHNEASGGGGGISNLGGTVTVASSTFSDNLGIGNTPEGYGGAIYNVGTLTVSSSTFSHNSTNGYGGAISNASILTITGSTISGNTADYGGGIANKGTATVTNSTLYGNLAISGGGGGIYNYDNGTLAVTNSTIASNMVSGTGGGIDNVGSVKVSLGSSIVSGNTGLGPDLFGDFKSLGYNVIGSGIGGNITGNSTGNRVSSAASPLNLGDLADNGGPTQTQSLGNGSVAIGAGNCDSLAGIVPVTTDQRGIARKPTCDVGAYET